MIYRIAFEADKHWGAMRPEDQYKSSFILKQFLAQFPIDLYVNLGDFFDTKLLLNSKASIYAVRDFTEKLEICASRGIPVRAIRGTSSHDYDQWNIFDKQMNAEGLNFRYFSTCFVEETLPGLRIWYAPEENMNFSEYVNLYGDLLMDRTINMAALHGNFDRVVPSIKVKAAESDKHSTDLIFKYDILADIIHGPMVAGHWHDGDQHEHLAYVGSYDRWSFGEDEPKGFAIYEYNTETEEYRMVKVPNILAGNYKTYEVFTSLYFGIKEYKLLVEAVRATLEGNTRVQVRILIKIDQLYDDTEQQIENLKFRFANEKRVKFTIINQIRTESKKREREVVKQLDSVYKYVRDKKMKEAEKIHRFIMQMNGNDRPVEKIQELIGPYLS